MAKLNFNPEYSESRGYNLGIAREVGLAEAVVFNQLMFWQGVKGHGVWFYKSYAEMVQELPLSERTIRNAYDKLKRSGYIETKRQKVNGTPTLHFRICKNVRMEPAKSADTKEPANITETINNKTPIKNIHSAASDDSKATALAHHVHAIYELYLKCFKLPPNADLTDLSLIEKAKKRYKLTPARRDAIERRLKDAGFNMLRAAIVGYSREPWYQGENDRGWTADLQKFICRSYEKVEEGANKYESQKAGNHNDPWANL